MHEATTPQERSRGRAPALDRPPAVRFSGVHKAFGPNHVLRGLDLEIPQGQISMILGPSGTGKSVCIRLMVGLLRPDRGTVEVHGESISRMSEQRLIEVRQQMGVLFQDGALFGSMNVLNNVAYPLRQHRDLPEAEIIEIAASRLAEVGLLEARDLFPNELSGGMRKRAGFARALALDPDIVLFDEPDSGLDPVRTALLGELIREVHAEMMETARARQAASLPAFCLITHDIATARRVAEYIIVLWRGEVIEAGPAEQVLASEDPFVRQFLAGRSQGPLTME